MSRSEVVHFPKHLHLHLEGRSQRLAPAGVPQANEQGQSNRGCRACLKTQPFYVDGPVSLRSVPQTHCATFDKLFNLCASFTSSVIKFAQRCQLL